MGRTGRGSGRDAGRRRPAAFSWTLSGTLALAFILTAGAACGGGEGDGPPRAEATTAASDAPRLQTRAGSGGQNADRHLDVDPVVMISFDGFAPWYLEEVDTPSFDRVVRRGARAASLVPVFPTKTFPNHYSLATGMYPARHGIVDNNFWDPERGERYALGDRVAVEDGSWYGGEPIWVTAETQGMVSAAYFWVGTEADVQGVHPTFWHRYDGSVPNEARVDRVLEWLAMPERERPRLVMLYFSDVDSEGHRHGPDSPELHAAVRRVDAVLGRLLDGLERLPHGDRVHLVLVSDHGMARGHSEKTYDISEHVDLEGIRVEGWGPYRILYLDGDEDRIDEVRARLGGSLRHAAVLRPDEAPARWHHRDNPRLGDLLVLGELPWLVGDSPEVARRAEGGHHGWDPAHAEMHGIFIAAGPRIREGIFVPSVEAVHVYPFVAHLLGLEANPDIDGGLEELGTILR